jgi:hypothetical protein
MPTAFCLFFGVSPKPALRLYLSGFMSGISARVKLPEMFMRMRQNFHAHGNLFSSA